MSLKSTAKERVKHCKNIKEYCIKHCQNIENFSFLAYPECTEDVIIDFVRDLEIKKALRLPELKDIDSVF